MLVRPLVLLLGFDHLVEVFVQCPEMLDVDVQLVSLRPVVLLESPNLVEGRLELVGFRTELFLQRSQFGLQCFGRDLPALVSLTV